MGIKLKLVIAVSALTITGASYAAAGAAGCGLGSLIFKSNGKFTQLLAATTNNSTYTQSFGITSGTSNCNAKGFANGTANSVLDAVPFVGNFKVFIEIFTGDFIPDLPEKTSGETGQDQEELPKGYYFEMVYDAFVANPGPKFDINPNR